MDTTELAQGTDAWRQARCGSLGASAVHDALAKTKTGWGASRANVHARLVAERLTGNPAESFTNAAMQWGNDFESDAREAYSFVKGISVVEVGLFKHPRIAGTHASPDGFANGNGLVEIKCPNTATHIETLTGAPISDRYMKQMQWQMSVCDKLWCDFASYDPRMPIEMQLHVRRVDRDDAMIADMEVEITKFLAEVDATVAALSEQYLMQKAA